MIDSHLLEQALADTRDGVVIADAQAEDQPIVYVNPAFEKMTGYSEHETLGSNCRFLQGEDRDQPAIATLRHALTQGNSALVTLRNYRKDGALFWNELSISPVHDNYRRLTHFIGIQKDVTLRTRAVQQLQGMSDRLQRLNERHELETIHDPLTDLYNARYFRETLEREWRRALRRKESIACFEVSVDNFSTYVDAYGAQAADRCIDAVGSALKSQFKRASDSLARRDGGHFVAISPGLDLSQAVAFAELLRSQIQALKLEHVGAPPDRVVTASLGVAACVPAEVSAAQEFLGAARSALEDAMRHGDNRVGRGLVRSGIV